jgi:hypothetical protein
MRQLQFFCMEISSRDSAETSRGQLFRWCSAPLDCYYEHFLCQCNFGVNKLPRSPHLTRYRPRKTIDSRHFILYQLRVTKLEFV